MAETIRQYFKRRTRRSLTLTAAGVVVGGIAVALYGFGYVRTGEVGAVAGVLILCAGLWHLDRTNCPRCHARLSATASSHRLLRPINFCPYCGVSLDAFCP